MVLDVSVLLESPEILLSFKSVGVTQFPAVLNRFFEVHGKGPDLIKFAIMHQLESQEGGKKWSVLPIGCLT